MKRFVLLSVFIIINAFGVFAQYTKYHFYADKMGSPFNVTIGADGYHIDSGRASYLFAQALQLVDSLNHILSDYDSTSNISMINNSAGMGYVRMHPCVEEILIIGKEAYKQTKGKYNIAIGPLSILWRQARKSKVLPSNAQINAAKRLIDFEEVNLDTLSHQVMLKKKGMRLDLGSLGKGYVAQKVMDYLQSCGIDYALVDAGGKIVTLAPQGLEWQVGINQLRDAKAIMPMTLHLSNQAVATSGDTYQFFMYKGKRFSHIIDVASGFGIQSPKSVTVIGNKGVVADWLSTACSILPIDQAIALAEYNKAKILIVQAQQGAIHYYQSKDFNSLLHSKF